MILTFTKSRGKLAASVGLRPIRRDDWETGDVARLELKTERSFRTGTAGTNAFAPVEINSNASDVFIMLRFNDRILRLV